MKVLVFGMNPSGRDLKHKKGPTLSRLENWMSTLGITYFSFVNTTDQTGDIKASNVDFNRLQILTKQYNKVIALGGFVSRTLNTINVDHFMLPHPSPLNRLLNDKTLEKKTLSKCKDYLND